MIRVIGVVALAIQTEQDAPAQDPAADALRRGLVLLMLLALLGVILVTTLALLGVIRKPGGERAPRVHRDDAWAVAADRIAADEGDAHLEEFGPIRGPDDPDPNDETTGPNDRDDPGSSSDDDQPWR